MNKKSIYIIVAVLVVIIIIAGAAAYILMNNGGNSGTNATPTPAPTAKPTVVGASTLQFNVNETDSTGTLAYMFSAKNVNTTNLVLRMDILGGTAYNYTYIIDQGAQTAKSSTNNGATWTTDTYSTDSAYITIFNGYVTKLADNWNGSDLTYTYTSSTGSTVLIFSICPNPTLPASLFATT